MLPHATMNMDVHSHQQCTRVLFSLHPCQPLFSVLFCSLPNGCEMVSHCGFELHFHND